MNGMIFRSFRKQNYSSQKNTNTVYSEYSCTGIVPKERTLSVIIKVEATVIFLYCNANSTCSQPRNTEKYRKEDSRCWGGDIINIRYPVKYVVSSTSFPGSSSSSSSRKCFPERRRQRTLGTRLWCPYNDKTGDFMILTTSLDW